MKNQVTIFHHPACGISRDTLEARGRAAGLSMLRRLQQGQPLMGVAAVLIDAEDGHV